MRGKQAAWKVLLVCFVCGLSGIFCGSVFADDPNEIVFNESPQSEPTGQGGGQLGFDPNDFSFLVYDCGSGEIQAAMNVLGLSYTVRDKTHPVTTQDLNTYDILIVGWKAGDPNGTDGLTPSIIEQGITGRIILTGHDTDWHTANSLDRTPAAKPFLAQCIGYILAGGGTGLLAHGEPVNGFNWLPASWGIDVRDGLAIEIVNGFTPDGIASEIFDGLTKEDMSNWYNSFHNTFESYGYGFKPFEMGLVEDANSVITIGAAFSPSGFEFHKYDNIGDDCQAQNGEIEYTLYWNNTTEHTFSDVWVIDTLPAGVDFVEEIIPQASPQPKIALSIQDANDLDDITLNVGQSVRLYVDKETLTQNIYAFSIEADMADPNLGSIDNSEYDPNNPTSAQIVATPRSESFDYFGPGETQAEGIILSAASLGNSINDGDLASFVYTATQAGHAHLTLVNYDEGTAAQLSEMVIHQIDPNDPNLPAEPNEPQPAGDPCPRPAIEPGAYDGQTHTITWNVGTIAPGACGTLKFTVKVNAKSEPGMKLHNVAEMYSEESFVARDTEDTRVCCWDTTDPNIIYVDLSADGNNNGTSWTDAYRDLQKALVRAKESACASSYIIYVAQGDYYPGTYSRASFILPVNVSVYGGFPAGGCAFEYRNPKVYITTLDGLLNETTRSEKIVQMGSDTLLDGFVVSGSSASPAGYGIYGKGVDFTVANCAIKDNQQYGIYAENANAEILWCAVKDSGYDGIRHIGNSKSIVVENCQILKNQQHGIYLENSISTIKNNVIASNGIGGEYFYGIRYKNPKSTPATYNNTIVYNRNEAVFYIDSDPNHKNIPDIQNCILWYNNVEGNTEQFAGWKIVPQYSCLYDPNDSTGQNYSLDANHNFSGKPGFAYDNEPNNVHLAYDSFCKDKGNPTHDNDDVGLYDMDKENRIIDSRVDVGADEIGCTDISNARDWNADGLVNLVEFNIFSRAWLSHDPNDPALTDPNYAMYSYYNDPNSEYYVSLTDKQRWNPVCDFEPNGISKYVIDAADLLVFIDADTNSSTNTDRWLWQACWLSEAWQAQQQSMIRMFAMPASQPQEMTAAAMPMEMPAEIVIPEKSITQQLAELKDSAKWLEELWKTEPELQHSIDAKSWQEFMDAVYENVKELEALNSQTLSESEELQ